MGDTREACFGQLEDYRIDSKTCRECKDALECVYAVLQNTINKANKAIDSAKMIED